MSTVRESRGWLAAGGAGVLWLVHVLLVVGVGAVTGELLHEAALPRLRRLDDMVFMAVYALLGVSLQSIHAALRGRQKALGIPGVLLSLAPLGAGLLGFLLLALDPETAGRAAPLLGPAAILGTFGSALLLGVATLRARELSRYVGVALLLFAILTMPLAFALPLLQGMLPLYALVETHFVFAGTLWVVIGAGLRGALVEPGAGFARARPEPVSARPRSRPLAPDEGLRLYAALREREEQLRRGRRRSGG